MLFKMQKIVKLLVFMIGRVIKYWKILPLIGVVLFVFFFDVIYLVYYSSLYVERDFPLRSELRKYDKKLVEYASKCECRRNENVYLMKNEQGDEYTVKKMFMKEKITREYKLSKGKFESAIFTCDMYNALRRGPNLNVVSYSLYGRNEFYYRYIKDLVQAVKTYYPGWIIRIHYDSSINASVICELECLKYFNQETNKDEFYDNVDFCDIEHIPFDLQTTWNASYMHGMSWRWLPIGDTFVDYVASRDTDAWISTREIDSVNVWLKSNTIFHVMRDSPVHNIPIVGGYWGFANVRDRELAHYLFQILINHHIAGFYNPNDKDLKGHDQFLLTMFFSKFSLRNSTTHDSYTCHYINGDPWPSKRPGGYCFVGCTGCCDQIVDEKRLYDTVCPEQCRPKNHQDWIYC